MKYCSNCGATVRFGIPAGDDRERAICDDCGRVHYVNPLLVVGCIPEWGGRILLCRRSIEPRRGFWTIPAGFMEKGETVEEGALRELREEALATGIDVEAYGMYSIRHISQVYMIFRTTLQGGRFGIGEETEDARLFALQDIPFGELAFPVVETALRRYVRDAVQQRFPFHLDEITEKMKRD